MSRCGLTLAVLMSATELLAADFIFPIQQARSLRADIWDPNLTPPAELVGPPSGPWYQVLSLDAPLDGLLGSASAVAVQYSEMTPSQVVVYGLADQQSDPTGVAFPATLVQSASRAWMRFAVPARVAFELNGDLSSEVAGREQPDSWGLLWTLRGRVSLALRRVAGPDPYLLEAAAEVLNIDPNCCEPACGADACTPWCYHYECDSPFAASSAPVWFAGELLPGVYELEVNAETVFESLQSPYVESGEPFRIESTMVVTMDFAPPTPGEPCNADLDGDGDVDLGDFARMQNCLHGPG